MCHQISTGLYLSPARANTNVKAFENITTASFRILFTSLLIHYPIIQSYINRSTDIAVKQATNKLRVELGYDIMKGAERFALL
jgi:hypothetical protein